MQITERDWSRLQTRGRAVPRDVKVAVDYMRQHIGRKIGIADIVTATGTPERTLHKHFARFFGLAPLAFLRRLRLAAARDALLTASSDSVTDVAARLCFTHFGRFSSDYRRCFRELPSETRRRANTADRDHALPSRGVAAPQLSGALPTLAILPFQTQGDRHSNWLADSIVELLAAELARARACSVRMSRSASDRAAQKPGTRYCVMGRVTHASDRVRVIVRLIDVADERHLWGDCYDGEASDVLALQDHVVGGVLSAVQPTILGDRIERARRGDPATLSGLDIALRALPDALSWNRSERAVDPLCQAMMLDPDCALATALAGWCHARQATPWNSKAVEERTLGNRLADRAGILAPADPMVLAMRASVAHLAREYDAADALAARAIARDPTCAWAWDRRGWVHEAIERPDDAIPFFSRVEGIPAPYLDGAESLNGVGTAHFCAGRYREAVVALRKAALVRPGSGALHGQLAACYVQLGDRAAARAELDILRRVLPDVSATQYVDGYPCGFASFKDALANSLTEIGMPA